MGIKGLWPILEPAGNPVTLESLEGKRVAIDVSIWLYQASKGTGEHQLNSRNPHLSLLINRLAKLFFYRIRPVFVFDGPNVPSFKRRVLAERRLHRHQNESKITKAQQKVLENAARSSFEDDKSSDVEESLLCTSNTQESDLFQLPPEYNDNFSSSENSNDSDFCDSDFEKRIEMLVNAKEIAKEARFSLEKIPSDSQLFSCFQLNRLLARNRINKQIIHTKKQMLETLVDGVDVKIMAFEGRKRGHLLYNDDETSNKTSRKEQLISGHDSDFKLQLAIEKSQDQSEIGRFSSESFSEMTDNDAEQIDRFSSSDDGDDDFVDVTDDDGQQCEQGRQLHHGMDRSRTNGVQIDSESREDAIYEECQTLLRLAGVPFVCSPSEAEAQCAHLEWLGLVDATVSDDSDVWLFGAKNVYRRLFSSRQHVQFFTATSLRGSLGLTRSRLVQLAMLCGADYTEGFRGVGLVTGLQLLAEWIGRTIVQKNGTRTSDEYGKLNTELNTEHMKCNEYKNESREMDTADLDKVDDEHYDKHVEHLDEHHEHLDKHHGGHYEHLDKHYGDHYEHLDKHHGGHYEHLDEHHEHLDEHHGDHYEHLDIHHDDHYEHLDKHHGDHYEHLDKHYGGHYEHLDEHHEHLDKHHGGHYEHLDKHHGGHYEHLDEHHEHLDEHHGDHYEHLDKHHDDHYEHLDKRHDDHYEHLLNRSALTTLQSISHWLQHPNTVISPPPSSNLTRLCTKFSHPPSNFPDPFVFAAYMHPKVDESEQPFEWSRPDLSGLRRFVWRKLGWSDEHLERIFVQPLKRWTDFLDGVEGAQTKMDTFLVRLNKRETDMKMTNSRRVSNALDKLRKSDELNCTNTRSKARQLAKVHEGDKLNGRKKSLTKRRRSTRSNSRH